jgi:arylsulfatase A-like enzyme
MGKFRPDRTVLPLHDPAFGGAVGRTLDQAVADWTIVMQPRPPADAPNVLVVLIDDAGFGNPDTFGGPISTPAMTRVREMGLSYNRFHVTAICSPTRAALLTGRNQHRVGFGSIAEYPGPFPGYTAAVPRSCVRPGVRILRDNGYVTGGFGKWHLTPDNVQGAAGPIRPLAERLGLRPLVGLPQRSCRAVRPDHHPGQRGTSACPRARTASSTTSPTTSRTRRSSGCTPSAPRTRRSPGSCTTRPAARTLPITSPRSGPTGTRDVRRGLGRLPRGGLRAPEGLGIVPEDAELTERPDLFPAWDSLNETEKKLYVRQMEVFAGFSENADWNVGRLLDSIEEMGDLDNTLIFYIWGDNGASMEGTITGSFNEMTFLNGVVLSPEQQLELIDRYGGVEALGGVDTAPHYASAWAMGRQHTVPVGQADRQSPGRNRDPMVVAWPQRIKAPARFARSSPTASTSARPSSSGRLPRTDHSVDGIAQEPMDGTSFAHTFEDAAAGERHTVQYFESMGSRAIYQDGWWACARLDRRAVGLLTGDVANLAPGVYDPEQDRWELYYLPDDFAGNDLAAAQPEKLAELKELFWQEAERNKALPLLGGMCVFFGILPPLADRDPVHRSTVTCRTFNGEWCRGSRAGRTRSRRNSSSPTTGRRV